MSPSLWVACGKSRYILLQQTRIQGSQRHKNLSYRHMMDDYIIIITSNCGHHCHDVKILFTNYFIFFFSFWIINMWNCTYSWCIYLFETRENMLSIFTIINCNECSMLIFTHTHTFLRFPYLHCLNLFIITSKHVSAWSIVHFISNA